MKAICYQCEPWRFVACRAVGRVWPGVCFSALGPARLRDVPEPDRLPPGWARVRIRQCGLCASDVHLVHLRVSPRIAPLAALSQETSPIILGHELVGVVDSVDSGDLIRAGGRVISRSGGFRNCFNLNVKPCPQCRAGEYAQCHRQAESAPPHEPYRGGGFASVYFEHAANLIPVPDALSDDDAALAEPLACALRSVLALATGPVPNVLVIGAGLQGLGAIHWLHCLRPEATVTCLARHQYQADLARALGARHVLLGDVEASRLAALLGTKLWRAPFKNELLAEGFDGIIDSIGHPVSVNQSLRWIRPGGSVVLLGTHLFPGRLDYTPLWFRQIRLSGVLAHGMEDFEGRRVPTLELTLQLLAERARLPVPLVTHRLPLSRFANAVRLMEHKGSSHAVRIVLTPQ